MLIIILILALICVSGVLLARSREMLSLSAILFFVAQISVAIFAIDNSGKTVLTFFTLDTMGTTYYCLMVIMGLLCAWRSVRHLETENLRHRRIYFTSLIALNVALTGVYFSNNLAVTWIFLEATTLATAGLTYHRRTGHALEATWKYIFVSSVGIAIAYLGVLLLSTASPETLSYDGLSAAVTVGGNPLYMRLAFLFILVGYSTKLEIFPLFTVGVDANHSAPTPASAFISSALVGGGFVALLRVYKVMQHSTVASWVGGVLIVAALVSLIAAAVYLGRTSNYKRLLAYSTLENSGIMMLGLGFGGVGVAAAVMHSLGHTIIKGVMYLQMSVVGRMMGSYKIGRLGSYYRYDGLGSVVLTLGLIALVAAPPSILFVSELSMLAEIVSSPRWWIVILVALPLLACLYWLVSKVLLLLHKPISPRKVDTTQKDTALSVVLLILLGAVFAAGVSPGLIWGLLNKIII